MDDSNRNGEYAPAGEESGMDATFSLDQIARAFDVEPDRVHRAMTGEFGSDEIQVSSKQAQHLAEVLLGDLPQDRQMAALITLGAYTPRPDQVEGVGDEDPDDESDKLADTEEERKRSLGHPSGNAIEH